MAQNATWAWRYAGRHGDNLNPLRWPIRVRAGEPVHQTVVIEVRQTHFEAAFLRVGRTPNAVAISLIASGYWRL